MGGKELNGDIAFDHVVVKQLGEKLESQNRKLSFHTFEKKVLLTTVIKLKICVNVSSSDSKAAETEVEHT